MEKNYRDIIKIQPRTRMYNWYSHVMREGDDQHLSNRLLVIVFWGSIIYNRLLSSIHNQLISFVYFLSNKY